MLRRQEAIWIQSTFGFNNDEQIMERTGEKELHVEETANTELDKKFVRIFQMIFRTIFLANPIKNQDVREGWLSF